MNRWNKIKQWHTKGWFHEPELKVSTLRLYNYVVFGLVALLSLLYIIGAIT